MNSNLFELGVPARRIEEYRKHAQNLRVYSRRAGLKQPDDGYAVAVGHMLVANGYQIGSRKATLTGLFFLVMLENATSATTAESIWDTAKWTAIQLYSVWYDGETFNPYVIPLSLREIVVTMVRSRENDYAGTSIADAILANARQQVRDQ